MEEMICKEGKTCNCTVWTPKCHYAFYSYQFIYYNLISAFITSLFSTISLLIIL